MPAEKLAELKPELVELLIYVLPGFVAAWVYHRLIALPRPPPFAGTVQALIFTVIIHFIVYCEKTAALAIGEIYSLGNWTSDGNTVAGFATAIVFGLLCVRCTADDGFLFKDLRRAKLTLVASYPSLWYATFTAELTPDHRLMVLQFRDGRRLYGWCEGWPASPERGHFTMAQAKWLETIDAAPTSDDTVTLERARNPSVELSGVSTILVSLSDIQWIEFTVKPSKPENEDASELSRTAAAASGSGQQGNAVSPPTSTEPATSTTTSATPIAIGRKLHLPPAAMSE